jgi:hypothetical protein
MLIIKISVLTELTRNIETKESSFSRDLLDNLYLCYLLTLNSSLQWQSKIAKLSNFCY